MKCPFCGCADTRVTDSRPTDDCSRIRRRRECSKCEKRFTTYEAVETAPLVVVKKNGAREQFDRNKLLRSMLRACDKRSVDLSTLEKAVDRIEQALLNSMEREISSENIGQLAMDELRKIDQVSYVRFASVYREFKDVHTFMREFEALLKDSKI